MSAATRDTPPPQASRSDTKTSVNAEPYYVATHHEIDIFDRCHRRGLPVLLKGPTGCGKTRFVEYMAWKLGRPLITVACHDDLSASDLTGRYLIRGGETIWVDGPVAVAARTGAVCYLDEVVEAREDTIVVIHPLTDDRKILTIDKTGEVIAAAAGFQLVASYNPGYQHAIKDLKPSTRQRFVSLEFDYPADSVEAQIVEHESGVKHAVARSLVEVAHRVRRLRDQGLVEGPGTRLLVSAGRLIAEGIPARRACEVAVAAALTDDPDLLAAIGDIIDTTM